jgi:alpha-L-fucosidase
MKFGMFIHWGIYSVLADGEWVMYTKKIPYDSYKQLAGFFNPTGFNAAQWVQLAKSAGMKYITITSRHHDGFSMFKTAQSPYNIVSATTYKKDPLLELAKEAEKEGIGLHFYYSLVDWGRNDYGHGKPIVDGKPENTDWEGYIDFMKKQLTELITQYPNVKSIWFDGHWDRRNANWHYDELYSLIHQLNPAILIGNNHHISPLAGEDMQMFEKDLPGENRTGFRKENTIADLPLETCETMNNSWGYNINDRNFKSSKQIIQMLVNAAGRNANLLLNVGPMPNGAIQSEFTDTLAKVGKWMEAYGESIYNTRGSGLKPNEWGVITAKDKFFFVHIMKKIGDDYLFIPGLKKTVTKASVFGSQLSVKFKQQPEGVFIYLNGIRQDDIDTIIRLETK